MRKVYKEIANCQIVEKEKDDENPECVFRALKEGQNVTSLLKILHEEAVCSSSVSLPSSSSLPTSDNRPQKDKLEKMVSSSQDSAKKEVKESKVVPSLSLSLSLVANHPPPTHSLDGRRAESDEDVRQEDVSLRFGRTQSSTMQGKGNTNQHAQTQ